MSKTRPARRKLEQNGIRGSKRGEKVTDYFLRSVSLIEGRPAKFFFLEMSVSLNTITRPPITLRFRRKKFKSKMRP